MAAGRERPMAAHRALHRTCTKFHSQVDDMTSYAVGFALASVFAHLEAVIPPSIKTGSPVRSTPSPLSPPPETSWNDPTHKPSKRRFQFGKVDLRGRKKLTVFVRNLSAISTPFAVKVRKYSCTPCPPRLKISNMSYSALQRVVSNPRALRAYLDDDEGGGGGGGNPDSGGRVGSGSGNPGGKHGENGGHRSSHRRPGRQDTRQRLGTYYPDRPSVCLFS